MEALGAVVRGDLGPVQRDLALTVELVCLLVVFSLDRVASHQQHVHHDAEAEQVALGVVRPDEGKLIEEDLRSHIADSAALPKATLISTASIERKPEVYQFTLIFTIDMDVLRLDIAMDDLALMEILQAGQDGGEDGLHLL